MNRDSGITTGLNGAIQRLIVNGDVMDDLVILAKDSRGITRYLGPPCNEVDDSNPKCQNGGICRPYFRSYICKCPPNYMGSLCEKGTKFLNSTDCGRKQAFFSLINTDVPNLGFFFI